MQQGSDIGGIVKEALLAKIGGHEKKALLWQAAKYVAKNPLKTLFGGFTAYDVGATASRAAESAAKSRNVGELLTDASKAM